MAAPVPSCPEWNQAALCGHVGWVHRMATAVLQAEGAQADLGAIASAPVGDELAYFRAGTPPLLEALRSLNSEAPAWNWTDKNQTAGFWARRQAHETTVHCWDAREAAHVNAVIDPALAVDGVAGPSAVVVGPTRPG
jgi:uncharacterized protein (TIGR03083 family)